MFCTGFFTYVYSEGLEVRFYMASLISSIKSQPRHASLAVIPAFLSPGRVTCCGVKSDILCVAGFSNTFIWSVKDSQRLRMWRKGIAGIHQSHHSSVPDWPSVWQLVFNISHGRRDLFIYLLSQLETWKRLVQIVNTVCFVLVMHFLRKKTWICGGHHLDHALF